MISPETLRRYPHFADMSEDVLKSLAMIASEQTFPAGQQLFYEGDTAKNLHVILSGEVDIRYVMGSGEPRTVDTLVAGDLLCWSALVEPYKTTAIGTATKDTRVVSLDGAKLREFCKAHPEVGYAFMTQVAKLLANRLDNARVQLAAVD